MNLDILLPRLSVIPVFICNALLEGIIWLRLNEQIPDGIQHSCYFGGWFPVLGLEDAETDVSEGVVGDVGVVDARGEAERGWFEGVFDGEGEQEAVFAGGEGRVGGREEGDLPGVDRFVGREGDGEAFGGRLADFGVFLGFCQLV